LLYQIRITVAQLIRYQRQIPNDCALFLCHPMPSPPRAVLRGGGL